MRFLADENFRRDMTDFLRKGGHDVKLVSRRASDLHAIESAQKEGRVFLTHDGDFSVTLRFPPGKYAGILIFRVSPPSFDNIKRALGNFLSSHTAKSVKGRTFIIEEGAFWEIE